MGHVWFSYANAQASEFCWGVEGGCFVVTGGSGPTLSWLLIL